MLLSSNQNCPDTQHGAVPANRVAIVGTGFVGASTAYALLMSGTAAEIVLIDLAGRGGKNGKKRAVVAVARKLAVLLHRLWVSDTVYEPLHNSQIQAASQAA